MGSQELKDLLTHPVFGSSTKASTSTAATAAAVPESSQSNLGKQPSLPGAGRVIEPLGTSPLSAPWGEDAPSSEVVDWVAMNLSVMEVPMETAPSSKSIAMLQWAKENQNAFWTLWSKFQKDDDGGKVGRLRDLNRMEGIVNRALREIPVETS